MEGTLEVVTLWVITDGEWPNGAGPGERRWTQTLGSGVLVVLVVDGLSVSPPGLYGEKERHKDIAPEVESLLVLRVLLSVSYKLGYQGCHSRPPA